MICQVDEHTLDQLVVTPDGTVITRRVHGAVLICVKTAAILGTVLLATSALRESYEQRATDMDPTILAATAELMILRRDEITEIAVSPSDPLISVQEVG